MSRNIVNENYKKRSYLFLTTMVILFLSLPSCKKFVEIDEPRTEIIRDQVFKDDATAEAAMVAVYIQVNIDHFANGWYLSDVAYNCGKSADEIGMGFDSEEGLQLFENELATNNSRVAVIWTGAYQCIYRINAILEGIKSSAGLSEEKKKQLEGEAKFMRAFNYFYLVNLFGDVPLITVTDFRSNSVASRTPVPDIYMQILQDLKDAQNLLPTDYVIWQNERIRPVQAAATALLARVHLYMGHWADAAAEATKLIASPLFSITSLDNVFLKNNSEAIWQFCPIQAFQNSRHGVVSNNWFWNVPLTPQLVNAFENGDNRLVKWTFYEFNLTRAVKYKIGYEETVTEYTTNLRLAEQYLIRAEARSHLDDVTGAREDIDVIRSRAGLSNTNAADKNALLAAVEQERRIEFFAEYGHRWLDLKRWGRAAAVLAPMKPKWQPTDILYPIPQTEIDKSQYINQNAGY